MDSNEKKASKLFFSKISTAIGIIIDKVEVGTLVFCVGALAALLITNVIAREFFKSIYFAEEVSEFLVIYTTFMGVSYGVRKARHIRMGAFLDMMNPRLEKIFILIICGVSSAVMFIMADASYEYFMHSIRKAHMTPALRVPYWSFYFILPVGFFMAGMQYIRTIIKNLTEKETWMSPEQRSEYEDEVILGD